jgi:starch-binding outer membrane protein, SusD/RagB family
MLKRLILIIIASLLISSSCTDFLVLEPQDELIREEYWKSEGDVVAVLGTSYAKMSDFLRELYYWSELRGGLLSPYENRTSVSKLDFLNYNISQNNELVRWDDFYLVINLANTIIEYAPLAEENDDTFSEKQLRGYIAEATFIRSFCYFQLVKTFRDVPLILEPYDTDGQDFRVEKSTESEIIEQLIVDLTGIIDDAFTPDDFELKAEKKGRATNNAIYALLADIYLWNNDYELCLETCDRVSNVFLVEGEEYISIFANEGNSQESIFELQFDYTAYRTTNDLFSLTSNSRDGDRDFVVSNMMLALFEQIDLRQNAPPSPLYPSGGEVTVRTTNLSLWKYVGLGPYASQYKNNERTKNQSDANWIFYRLAEIHLMRAEAYAELGELSNALIHLNIIKNRAGLKDYTNANEQDKLLNEILNERAREFFGEGKRWFDLVRISRRDVDNRLNFISDAVISNVEARSRSAVASKIKDVNSWFLPIYYNELLLNNLLEQNVFYRTN